jgi:hypothetical protein
MKFLYPFQRSIFFLLFGLLTAAGYSQCPDCTPDPNCVSADGFPALCPLTPDDATAGTYYEEQLTFFMPALITDPGTGIEATLISVTVSSVSGMPYGLEFTINDDDGVFYPSAGDGLGCATICGVPLLPGTYSVVITVNAIVEVFGFEASQSQSFTLTLVVVPGEGSANSFSYDNIAGCGEVSVNYEALISVGAPSVTTYTWDFGNGQIGEGSSPETITYSTPGEYTVSLTTTVSDYKLNNVSVSSLNDNWSGDFDDLISEADVYFVLLDATDAIVFTSSTNDNVTSTSWDIPSIVLSNPPYSLQFFDEDDISEDDNLGAVSIDLSAGTNFFDAGNSTTGFSTVALETTTQITDSTTITVFPTPSPILSLSGNTFSVTADDVATVVWYINGNAQEDVFGLSLEAAEGGLYTAEVTNSFGCSAMSNSLLYCAPVSITYDALAAEMSVDDIYETYQWYYNGLALDGGNTSYVPASEPGNYMVEVTTDYGCTIESAVYILEVGVRENTSQMISVYPSPAENHLFIRVMSGLTNPQIEIFDILGQRMDTRIIQSTGRELMLDVSAYPAGVYFAKTANNNIRWIKK